VIRNWKAANKRSNGGLYTDKGRLKAFLKKTLCEKS
jgi:hypothetical protein